MTTANKQPPAGARDASDFEYRTLSLPGANGDRAWLPWQQFGTHMQIRERNLTGKADGGDAKCPACDGQGWDYNYTPRDKPSTIKCSQCKGTGKAAQPASTGAGDIDRKTAEFISANWEKYWDETNTAATGMGELLATWRAGLIDAEKRGDEGYIAGWKDCMQGRIKDLEALAAAPVAAGGLGDSEIRRVIHELRTYDPIADEYKGAHIHGVWARELEAALAAQLAPAEWQPTPCPVCLGFCGDKGPTCTERHAAQPAPVVVRDYAIEHAEYMALGAERLIDSINEADRLRDECDQSVESIDEVEAAYAARGDCMTGLRSAIYEFRKRRGRQTAQPAPVVGGPVLWWNGVDREDIATGPSVSVQRSDWHTIPLYEHPVEPVVGGDAEPWGYADPKSGRSIHRNLITSTVKVGALGEVGEMVDASTIYTVPLYTHPAPLLAARPGGEGEAVVWVDPYELMMVRDHGGMLVATHEAEPESKRTQPLYAHPVQAGGGKS